MRVLFVASLFNHITTFHIPYIKYMQSLGAEVWVACNEGTNNREAKKNLENMGVKCVTIDFSRSPFSVKSIKSFLQIKKIFKNEKFKFIHVHTPNAGLITRLANKVTNKSPIIYTAHGFHFYKGAPLINWLIYFPIEIIATRWTNNLITINSEDYNRIKKFKSSKCSLSLVHGVGVESKDFNNIDIDDRENIKKSLGISEDSLVITYIAELNKNKNHMFMLYNWKKIKLNNPKAVLLVVGEGKQRDKIEQFISNENLTDIYLLGYRKDVDKILLISEIVCLLSFREGLPKSIMEAMVYNIPCVVADTRGLRDLVKNGENGFLVKQGDDKVLINAFNNLLESPELRKKMGKDGSTKIIPYLMENVLDEYNTIYKEMMKEGEEK